MFVCLVTSSSDVAPPGHWVGHPWFQIQGLLFATYSQKAAPALPWGAQLCLVCELRVSVCIALSAFILEVFLTPLVQPVSGWSGAEWGSSGPLPRSQAKNFMSFCWMRLSTGIGFLKGKVYFSYHCQSQFPTSGILIAYQAAVCIFCCPTCLNLSPYDPSACSLSAIEQSIFQEGVLYRHISGWGS